MYNKLLFRVLSRGIETGDFYSPDEPFGFRNWEVCLVCVMNPFRRMRLRRSPIHFCKSWILSTRTSLLLVPLELPHSYEYVFKSSLVILHVVAVWFPALRKLRFRMIKCYRNGSRVESGKRFRLSSKSMSFQSLNEDSRWSVPSRIRSVTRRERRVWRFPHEVTNPMTALIAIMEVSPQLGKSHHPLFN